MINLITGLPGSGKTLHMVSMLLKNKELKNRPLYIDGIPDIDKSKINYIDMPENCTGENWQDWLPNGSILIIDECQRYWRTRPNGSKVPEAVQAMETHRHKGVDIYLLTQHPQLIDANVRKFVANHKHISKSQLGLRRMWEWQRAGNPDNAGDIRQAQLKTYRLDKSAYGVYKSAEQHTKISTSRSIWVWALPLAILLAITFAIYGYYYNKSALFTVKGTAAASAAVASGELAASTALDVQAASSPLQGTMMVASSPQKLVIKSEDYKPEIDGKPWTAPVYSPQNTEIKTMPYPVACVKSGNNCHCYTEQATVIRGLGKGLCEDMAENGIYNPYLGKDELHEDVKNDVTK